MREAILSAVRAGHIEEVRHAWDLNELKPDLGAVPAGGDPIAHWKRISGDGEGREILAALGEVLDTGYVVLPLGRDLENNKIYVWPYFAEVPLDKLTPGQEVELLRLVSPSALKDMRAAGTYAHWRIAIGADGTWHSFRRGPKCAPAAADCGVAQFKTSVTSCICRRGRLGRVWDTGKLQGKAGPCGV